MSEHKSITEILAAILDTVFMIIGLYAAYHVIGALWAVLDVFNFNKLR